MDADLLDELDEASRKVAGVIRVPTEVATAYVHGLAAAFVADPSNFHWWESLKGDSTQISYDNDDGLAALERILGEQAEIRLVVTDETAPPWPVYAGSATQLIAVLRECRFCEYMVASPDMSWVVFDTHMNELVSVGLKL